MAKVTNEISYYNVRRNGRGFWEPPKWAREMGIKGVACGKDGPDAWAKAEAQNERLEQARGQTDVSQSVLAEPGSLAHWYFTWRTLDDFKIKSKATQDEFRTNWNHIGPILGDKQIGEITADDLMLFHMRLDQEKSPRVRWGAVRQLRSILLSAQKRGVIHKAPELLIPNSAPPARTAIWYPQEIEALIEEALEQDRPGLALVIRVAFETALSPVDIRTLSLEMIAEDAEGAYIDRSRSKTKADAEIPLSDALWADIKDYIKSLPFELVGEAPIFRKQSTLKKWEDSPDLSKCFRRVRNSIFPGDDRKLMDIRRTVSFMADLGGASPDERGHLLANTIGENVRLNKTYSPDNVIKARRTLKKRAIGEEILRQLGAES